MDSILKANATLVKERETFQWKVAECPICGGTHWHGAGKVEKEADRFLSHRIAHCDTSVMNAAALARYQDSNGGYTLVKEG